MSAANVEQELRRLFITAIENVDKAKEDITQKKSLEKCSDRFLKLAKRLYDIYRFFDEEFAVTIDVIAAKAMLLFARCCFTVVHVLRKANWFKLSPKESSVNKIKSLPKRAAHKVWKRTFQSSLYKYQHEDDEYKQIGLVKMAHEQGKQRNYVDELSNIAITLKDVGSSLLSLAQASGLIQMSRKLDVNRKKIQKFDLDQAREDLSLAHDVLQDYYKVVLEQIEAIRLLQEQQGKKEGEGSDEEIETSDECLYPLIEKYGMQSRELQAMRGNVNFKNANGQAPKFQDLNNTTDDLADATKALSLLELGPEKAK